jgi:hypothetical protein
VCDAAPSSILGRRRSSSLPPPHLLSCLRSGGCSLPVASAPHRTRPASAHHHPHTLPVFARYHPRDRPVPLSHPAAAPSQHGIGSHRGGADLDVHTLNPMELNSACGRRHQGSRAGGGGGSCDHTAKPRSCRAALTLLETEPPCSMMASAASSAGME